MNEMKMSRNKFMPIYALLMPILLLSSSSQGANLGADYAKKEELYIEYKQPAQLTISSGRTLPNIAHCYPIMVASCF